MGQSRDTHMDKLCDICGDVGYEELIRNCSQCTIGRHLYCMRVLEREVSEDWVCEVCLSNNDIDSLNSGQTKNVLDSCRKVCFNLGRQVACKRKKAVETGKVKFLPTEEVIKLSSGLSKTASPLKCNTGSKPLPANFTPYQAKRTFAESTNVGSYFNPIKVRRYPSFLQLGSVNLPRGRGVQISSSISQHAVKAPNESKEDEEKATQTLAKKYSGNEQPVSSVMAAKEVKSTVNAKAMNTMKETLSASATSKNCLPIVNTVESAHVVPNRENVCKGKILDAILPDKELSILHTKTEEAMSSSQPSPSRHCTTIIRSGQNFHDAAESENSNVAERETWNRLKISLYRPHAPALYPIWTGGFKFLDTAISGEFYGGFLAQPPCRVHRKAYEFSQKMPPVLQVNLLQQCHLQADLFQNGCLDLCDIALYFLPVDYIERSQKNYNQLFQLMGIKNSVMISYIDDMELLIFTSKQLHADSQDVFTRSKTDFFGGVFCRAKENQMKVNQKLPSLVSHSECMHDGKADMDSSEAVDMDIDMIGGKIVGIPDMALPKESTREFNKWAARETLDDVISDWKLSTVSGDSNSVIQPISVASKQECCNDFDLPSKSTEKIKSKFPLEPVEHVEHPSGSSLGRLPDSTGETNIPPDIDMLKLNSSDREPEGKNDSDERRIMSQVKEEIGCQGINQVAFGVSRPQPPGSVEAFGVSRSQPHGSTEDASLQGSQNQHQVLAYHPINDPSPARLPPCLLGEGRKEPSERREKKGLQSPPFLTKDKSQIAGSCAVEVKAEVQEAVNDPSAACPPLSLNKGTKLGMQIKIKEPDKEKSDEMREKKGLQSSSFVSKDKSKTVAGSFNVPCAVQDKAEMQKLRLHATVPINMEKSLCFGLFASTRVKLSVAGRSRGSPGAASVGGLIRDESGKWIAGYNLNLGIRNCLATDLWALFQGMKFAWDRGYRKVLVESDSSAAMESLKKAPSLLNSNRALIESCRALINGEWDCKVYPIQREENLCADWLATHAEGLPLGLSIINLPPLELIPLLENDYTRVARTLDSPSAVCLSSCKSC